MSSNKLKETRVLYEREILEVRKTPEKWRDFLDFAANMQISKPQNEYEFLSKLIIHAKNPNATDCRLFGEWKTSDGNHVKYGEHGITVLSRDRNGNQSVMYLFDTSQTALKKEPELLEIPEEIKENLKSALSSMIEKFSNNAAFSDEQKRIFKASAEYKLCKQYGLETNDNAELFSGIEKLSVKEIANIGISLNRCGQSFSEIVNNERSNFYETLRSNANQSRDDRAELYERESRGMDLGRGSSDAHEEVRLQRGSERMEQAERGTGSVRADDLGTSAEANSSDGQVRQHETEIHMADSVSDRSDNAERGIGSRGGTAESSLRGNERESSEPDKRYSGEEETVGGIQGDRGIGTIPAESADTGEVQSRSGGRSSSRDGLRNITEKAAEPERVAAVSFSEKVHAAFAEVAQNHTYTARQQKFLERLEKFAIKHHLTENLIDEMAKLPAFHTHYNNRNTLSRSVFAGRLGSLERELTDALQKQLTENSMDKAIRLIHEYCESEFGEKANLSNMDHVDLAYTTDEYSELPIEVYADLEIFRIVKEYDGTVVSETLYDSLEDMHGDLANLEFDELVALSDEEKNMVTTTEEKADNHDKTAPTEYSNEIVWSPILETADDNGRAGSYSTKYNGKFYWITQNADGGYDIEADFGHSILNVGEKYSNFPTRFLAEEAFEDYIEELEQSFLYGKQALISIEIFGEEHYFKINENSVDNILKTANTEKPLLEFMEMGEKISEEEYAEIQQSDSFTFSVEMNLDNDTARIYTVNNGNGGISEADRTDNNVTFDTVKITDYSGQTITANSQEIPNEANVRNASGEQAIFSARPEEEKASITGQLSLFGETSDIEDFPNFTEEENISDNAVNEPVEKSDSFRSEKNNPVNDSSEVSAEKQEKEPTVKKEYFRITDEHLGEGSKKEKFRNNIAAIKTLQILESEERAATHEEQETLSKYIGWGGLQEAFDDRITSWNAEYYELKNLLSEEEYEAARSTVMDAFYTSPAITQAIYEGLANIGFEGGEVLEPSMGIGNFFGTMPDKMRENSNLAGIEIDSISGRIAQKLYPEANIAINGFEKVKPSKGTFDLAVGNVPFGNHGVNDKTKAYSGLLIHDYFFAKSLDSVRSGGIVAFVTSTGTLDKEDIKIRQMLAQKAELLGAVRLPNNAFQKNAGTPTTTDIIFLKKREKPLNISDMPMDRSCDWVHTKVNADGLKINSYFADNPEMVLGTLSDNGRFGSKVCSPIQGADLKEQLHEAMKNIKGEYVPLEFQQELDERAEDKYLTATPDIENLTYTVVDNKLYFRVDDNLIPLKESEQHGIVADRRKAMCGLGETVRELLQAQVEDRSDKEIKLLQAELNVKYGNFVKKYGRINPIETPNPRNASGVTRKATNSNAFKNDVRLPLLQSLENMKEGQFVGKTAIFTERTIRPRKVAEHVETSQEALILSVSEKGKIDFDYMEKLTGFEKEKIISDLKGDIYPVPELSTEDNTVYQTNDEYLSGNIYKKIAIAESRLSENPAYAENIAALTKVIPTPLKATEIDMQLGMAWIDTKIIQQFMYETFETPPQFKEYDKGAAQKNPTAITVQYSGAGKGSWKVENARLDNSVKSTKNFGTKDFNAYELLEKILNAKSVAVTQVVKDDEGRQKTIILEKETKAAEDKVKQINAAFKRWIFADPERRNELVKTYNEKFNGIRPREYDGSSLNFFGSNPEITLKPHQKNAVAHALFGGNTLFAHQVGAGKTFEMIATAMEGKRLGLHNKSMFVVPNHLTEQIGSDFMKLYPNANILVAKPDDFSPQKRRQMCARIATGNFDAVIIGHSQLIKIPLSAKREEAFIRNQIDEVMSALEAAEETDSKSYTVKQLEATRKKLRERLEKLTNGTVKDNAVTFEELGVDKLFVDEGHQFKNLYVSTKMENVSGLSTNADVQKTQDLYMKCQYLDEKTGGRGIVFSTGTPVTNALSEMFTMQKYLQSDLLKETGLESFDAWAGNFTRKSTEAEISPSGSDWKMKTRLKFTNVPELVTMFKECADIKMADQLDLDVPECEKHIVAVEPTASQKTVVRSLAERAEKISHGEVSRTEDNMLVVTGDGRKLGLDQRLYDLNLPDEPQTKLNACVQNVFDIWERTSDKKSTQLIFCDLGVPQSKEDFKKNGERFDVYADIRSKLIEKGVPEKEIAFIHEANSETEKAKLFAKVRSGDVRVLIGSTQKMGAGTNVQDKLVALHDLDCPWRPADLTQRLGRMVRQGNENDKVDNYRYVTKGTFDSYLYQMVEKKQESISQIFTSKAIARTCDDIDDMTVDFMQVKMAAVGDDRIRRQMELREDIRSLNMLKNTYLENKYEIEDNIKFLPQKIAKKEKMIEGITADTKMIKGYVPKKDIDGKDIFEMKIGNAVYTDKKEAAEALKNAMTKAIIGNPDKQTEIAEYKGFKIAVSYDSFLKSYKGYLKGENSYQFDFGMSESGNLTRIDNAIAAVPLRINVACNELERLKKELADSQKEVDQPFEHEAELEEKKQELDRLTDEINADKVKGEITPEQPESSAPDAASITEICDPYFMKVDPDILPTLEKSGLNFGHCERNGETIIKFDRSDRDKVNDIIGMQTKNLNQHKPKL